MAHSVTSNTSVSSQYDHSTGLGSADATNTVSTSQLAGQKRKRPVGKKYYAVKEGKTPGIYDTWQECLEQVKGCKGALFKAFPSRSEAQAFIDGKIIESETTQNPTEQKFYAVQNGRVPGVYTDWPSAQAQIRGFKNPKHKKFLTRAEAEAFVTGGKKPSPYDAPSGLSPDEENRRNIIRNSAPGFVMDGVYAPKDKQGLQFELGRGPLPPGAEDGYDPNIKLAPNGEIIARTEGRSIKTKTIPKERDPQGMLRIYTDGSSLKNGQAGARAGVGVFFGPQDPKYALTPASSTSSSPRRCPDQNVSSSPSSRSTPLPESAVYVMDWRARGASQPTNRPRLTVRNRNVSEALKGSKQTNQRAELTAILRALDIAPRHRDVTIYTDSKYSIECVTNWYKNWERNSWLNAKGKAVENKDLVQDVREKMEERELLGRATYFVWVKGHATDAGNIAADRLANEGARLSRGVENKYANHAVIDGLGHEDNDDDSDDFSDDEVRESFRLMKEAQAER